MIDINTITNKIIISKKTEMLEDKELEIKISNKIKEYSGMLSREGAIKILLHENKNNEVKKNE